MADDETFARRWSRRKQEVREEKEQEQAAVSPTAADEPDSAAPPEDRAQTVPEDLPDIESLDSESDYRVFMRDDVPEELRTLALRKLWRSNPLFSIIDGLDEYAEDFTDAALVPKGGVTSAYKIGRGYAEEAAEKVAEIAEDELETDEDVAERAESEAPEDPSDEQPADEAEIAEAAEEGESDAETEPPIEKS